MSNNAVSNALDAHIVVEREAFALDARFTIDGGSTLALLGPNGAGKSTTLRALAGLIGLSGGHIRVGERTLDDAKVRVEPERRGVGFVFQDYLLFPHLTVLENVAFGLRARGISGATARGRAGDWLDRVGLSSVLQVRPGQLSGGQAQRVALARALVLEPDLLLLDEPLAALDAETRPGMRSELATHLSDFAGCAVIVSHDPVDALVLGDRLLVLEHGRIVQSGTPSEVATDPRTDYVARLMGLNLLVDSSTGARRTFPPSAVSVTTGEDTSRLSWRGTVIAMEQQFAQLRVMARTEPHGQVIFADLGVPDVAGLHLAVGTEVWLGVAASDIQVSGNA